MDTAIIQQQSSLVTELQKNGICASASDAEMMASEIIQREKQVSAEVQQAEKDILAKFDKDRSDKEEAKVTYLTRADVESLLQINNKIIESHFVKLKNYADEQVKNLQEENRSLRSQINNIVERPVQPVAAPQQTVQQPVAQQAAPEPVQKNEDGFSADDVSIEKMFYMGNK